MKYCIAVQEVLRKEVVIEADNIDEACDLVQRKYDNEKIVLGSEDLVSMPRGEHIFPADWYTDEEVQDMEESEWND